MIQFGFLFIKLLLLWPISIFFGPEPIIFEDFSSHFLNSFVSLGFFSFVLVIISSIALIKLFLLKFFISLVIYFFFRIKAVLVTTYSLKV
jgi:hypothetical protein